MKKALILIFATNLFCSCSTPKQVSKNNLALYVKNSSSNFEAKSLLMVRYMKPSESMQPGAPKREINPSRSRYYYEEIEEDEDSSPYQTQDESKLKAEIIPETVPEGKKYRGYFKIGKPYNIYGTDYFPQNYDQFEQVGVASWYGAAFHGKETANGEIYNSGDMTAAHRTLPLPSIARVTNLSNGKIAIVRVNDRGPFAKDRVMDVSEKVAEILGFKNAGTTDIKVELLRDETDKMLTNLNLKN